ncbi:4F2 cell-surface antigen heavy chain-like [Erpetoichthys calabaricus]|uniref:Solute carrier family 3 member 2 n=1 Tax=Erpetoichthys calabaricus TaxID=27687 RepID=A0A8C4S112_ERPCA|nr:4F2 cell-surface antigen heavy chain-like [Erpetoichthys calabaricus]
MSKDSEVDMKEVELNEMDMEKQPMNTQAMDYPAEKNGCVKVKVPEEMEEKFTGLSKEELLKVAGTPGWVRTRWALLILFWLGWLGMLAGAIVIIVQAPRCKPIPEQKWWNKGAMYQISSVENFQDSNGDGKGDLTGIKNKIDHLEKLKVKGLILGPIYQSTFGSDTDMLTIDQTLGLKEHFTILLEAAQKKDIGVVLDLTPDDKNNNPWNNISSPEVQNKLKAAFEHWLTTGIDGIMISQIEGIKDNAPSLFDELRNLTDKYTTDTRPRVLIGVTSSKNIAEVVEIQNISRTDLLLSGILQNSGSPPSGSRVALDVQEYIERLGNSSPAWSVGSRTMGHLSSLVEDRLVRLYSMMLFTLPGTPFINYGDEIGLSDYSAENPNTKFPMMLWSGSSNMSVESQKLDGNSLLNLYIQLSELKVKDRSLKHGDFFTIFHDNNVYAYLREWDQSERFLTVLNFGDTQTPVSLKHEKLPAGAEVVLSTHPQRQKEHVDLTKLMLEPSEGLLLRFPYVS